MHPSFTMKADISQTHVAFADTAYATVQAATQSTVYCKTLRLGLQTMNC